MPVASFGSVEEKARGSLHMHVVCWTGLPPNLLQAIANIPVLVKAVAKALDMMIKAEVNSEVHVQYLHNKVNKVVQSKPAHTKAHHPSEESHLFNRDVQQAAIMCNSHQHSSTCHSGRAGKTACRLCRPQASVNKTSCCQIKPYPQCPTKKRFSILIKFFCSFTFTKKNISSRNVRLYCSSRH